MRSLHLVKTSSILLEPWFCPYCPWLDITAWPVPEGQLAQWLSTWAALPTRGENRGERPPLGVPYGDLSLLELLPASCMRTLLCSFLGSMSIGALFPAEDDL